MAAIALSAVAFAGLGASSAHALPAPAEQSVPAEDTRAVVGPPTDVFLADTETLRGKGVPGATIAILSFYTSQVSHSAVVAPDGNWTILFTPDSGQIYGSSTQFLVQRIGLDESPKLELRSFKPLGAVTDVKYVPATPGGVAKLVGKGRLAGDPRPHSGYGSINGVVNQVFIQAGVTQNLNDIPYMPEDISHNPEAKMLTVPIPNTADGSWSVDLPASFEGTGTLWVRQMVNRMSDNYGSRQNGVAQFVQQEKLLGTRSGDTLTVSGTAGATVEFTNDADEAVGINAAVIAASGTVDVQVPREFVGTLYLTARYPALPDQTTEVEVLRSAVALTTPEIGAILQGLRPVFSGVGEPGAAIGIADESGRQILTTEVAADGTWSAPSAVDLLDGQHAGTVTQTAPNGVTTAPFAFSISQASITLLTPATGSISPTSVDTFTGTGAPGATVTVLGSSGRVLATATVDSAGTWTATTSIVLADGRYLGSALQTAVGGKQSMSPFDFSIKHPPVTLTSPGVGATIEAQPMFAGMGAPGALVSVISASGGIIAETVVDATGAWKTAPDADLLDGRYTGTVKQTGSNGSTSRVPFDFTIMQPPVVLLTPATGGTVGNPKPVFTGTGTPGATVSIAGNSGTILAKATVDSAGNWAATFSKALVDGRYVGTLTQTTPNGKQTTAPFNFTLTQPAVVVTSPTNGGTVTGPLPVFTGTGAPYATVEVRGSSGVIIASTTVRVDGTWSATSTISLGAGTYVGTVKQIANNNKGSSAALQYSVK